MSPSPRISEDGLDTILLIHERYRRPGGEDVVFESEAALLERHGHRVIKLVVGNDSIPDQLSLAEQAGYAAGAIWSVHSAATVRRALERYRPGVVHVHNTFPLLSPSIYSACRSLGVPVVQTLHNYRLICPVATLFRDGGPCEDCVGRLVPWPGVLHGCYHSSRPKSAVVAAMITVHGIRKTWRHDVDVFVVPTLFAKQKFMEGGLPEDRILVKRHFVAPDPGVGEAVGSGFLFVGRLTEEKGVGILLDSWRQRSDGAHLRVVGDGPLRPLVEEAASTNPMVDYVGVLQRSEVVGEMQRARAVIVPSIWYEGHPLTILEAFAVGRPVIASRLGSMVELVDNDRTGILFAPGDAADLARAVSSLAADVPKATELGANARREYLANYTPDTNYDQLLTIYRRAASAPFEDVVLPGGVGRVRRAPLWPLDAARIDGGVRRMGWAVADQCLSSLTNFALTIYVARSFGLDVFGAFSLAFGAFLIVLSVLRAYPMDPLAIRYTGSSPTIWRRATAAAIGTVLLIAVAIGVLFGAIGFGLDGSLGEAFVALGIWLPGLLVQDAWRVAFFAGARGKDAFLNDFCAAVILLPALALLTVTESASLYLAMACWGASATAGAIFGAWQARTIPQPQLALDWWREHAALGPRLMVEVLTREGTVQLVLYGIGAVAGLAAVGTIRAGQLLLAPVRLLMMATNLVAVPEAVAALRASARRLGHFSARTSLLLVGLCALWAVFALMAPSEIGRLVLGPSWDPAQSVLIPLAVAMAAEVSRVGPRVGLRALAAAADSLRAELVSALAVPFVIIGAAAGGTVAAAWGIAIASLLSAAFWWRVFVRRRSSGVRA